MVLVFLLRPSFLSRCKSSHVCTVLYCVNLVEASSDKFPGSFQETKEGDIIWNKVIIQLEALENSNCITSSDKIIQ